MLLLLFFENSCRAVFLLGKLHQFKNSAFLVMTVDERAQEIWLGQYYLYLRSNLNFKHEAIL